MKKSILIILMISFVTISNIVKAQDNYSYTIYSLKDTIVQGESITLYLSVNGIDKLMNNDTRLKSFESMEKFKFQIAPTQLGTHTYGPYKLKINKKKLVSNKITIEVVEQKDYKNELIVSIPDTIYQDSTITFQFMNNKEYISLKLKENESFEVVSTSSSSKMSINEGMQFKEFSKSYKLKFVEPGLFIITKEMFEDASEDFQIKEKKVYILSTKN